MQEGDYIDKSTCEYFSFEF